MKPWFTVEALDSQTYIISEYQHWEETHCYLLTGQKSALLIDTGLGIGNIGLAVGQLTDKPIAAVATHCHWDHIGGHLYFPNFFVHQQELPWISGSFPLSLQAVTELLSRDCCLPQDFSLEKYRIFQGNPTRVLHDQDSIDIGGRVLQVLHTPGHSPGHMCFWEEERGFCFTGDLAYKGILYANYNSTDPETYLTSLEKISSLPIKHLLPAHHSLDITPEILLSMRQALAELRKNGLLRHGSGVFHYDGWGILL